MRFAKLAPALLAFIVLGCAASRPPVPPGTIPIAAESSAADEAYGQEVLREMNKQFRLDTNDANIERVRDLVDRLSEVAGGKNVPWHTYVFADDSFKNAAATRGNHIFVWTGILKAVKNDGELAAVLAHEIAHVLARHTAADPNEEAARMIAGIAGEASGMVTSHHAGIGIVGSLAKVIVQQSVEALVLNPNLQAKELEADHVGLFLMADAGIDPHHAVDFWTNAQNSPDFSSNGLSVFSSHPSSDERLAALKGHLPEAYERYRRARRYAGPKTPPDNRSRDRLTIRSEGAPLYAEPDRSAREIKPLPRGSELRLLSQREGWLEVEIDGTRGWIVGRDAKPVANPFTQK